MQEKPQTGSHGVQDKLSCQMDRVFHFVQQVTGITVPNEFEL
jgi:hypothetical protein